MKEWWDKPLLSFQKNIANELQNKFGYTKWGKAFGKAGWILQELEKSRLGFKPNSLPTVKQQLQAIGDRSLREARSASKNKLRKQDAQIMLEFWEQLFKNSPSEVQFHPDIQYIFEESWNHRPTASKQSKIHKNKYILRKNIDVPLGESGYQKQLELDDTAYKENPKPLDDKKFKPVKAKTGTVKTSWDSIEKGQSKFTEEDIKELEERTAENKDVREGRAERKPEKGLKDPKKSTKPALSTAPFQKPGKALSLLKTGVKTAGKFLGPLGVLLTTQELLDAHQKVVERNKTGGRSRDYNQAYLEYRKRMMAK